MGGGIILPIVMLVILGAFGLFVLVFSKRQEKNSQGNDNVKKGASKDKSNSKEVKKEDVFNFMEFDEISDNMIIQNKGTKFTMMIQCKGINYDLMSDVEQLSVEEGFITFLNTLTAPIQLYVQAQNLDLKGTIKVYKEHVDKIRNEFEEVNSEYNRINEAFDSTQDEISKIEKERNKTLNVYEYASDIVNYVERISLNKSLLQRTFFVLVSYHSSEINAIDRFSKEEIRNICYNELVTRAQSIINGLASCSVSGRILNSNEVADVLYTAYNRDDKGLLSVREALESGFYRLYSTSEDIFLKKQKKLQEEIDNEARVKALEALKKSITNGEYISPRIEQLDIEEQISKKASEVVRRENVPIDLKEKANEELIKEFRKTKKELLDKAGEEYQDLVQTLGVDIGVPVETSEKDKENIKLNEETVINKELSEVADDLKTEKKEADDINLSDVNNSVQSGTVEKDKAINSENDENIDLEFDPTERVPEEKPIVKKVVIDNSNFEYNNELANKSRNDTNLNANSNFDDRLGSSEDDSII